MSNFQQAPIQIVKLLTSLSINLIFCAINNSQATTAGCSILSPCQCSFSNGTGIDLSRVDEIENPFNSSGVKYNYFPCSTNDEETSCPNNAALCSVTNDGKVTLLGTLQNVTFEQDTPDGTVHVRYMYSTGNTIAATVVVLRCTPMSDANIIEPDPLVSGRLVLHSKAACLTALNLGDDNKGISNGSVLVVMVLVFFSLYFFGGMAILKFIRGASGVEIIPHYEFWSDLPFLVKDGIVFTWFTISGCQGSASYDRI